MMESLPVELYQEIAMFLTIHELGAIRQTLREFHFPTLMRQRRFDWCVKSISVPRKLSYGPCMECMCQRFKAICISFSDDEEEIPISTVLANYCSSHARDYSLFHMLHLE